VTMSRAPLRMLITQRTERHRLIGVQYLLSSMGFLVPQNFDGTFGKATVAAIKAFQRAHDLPETTALTDGLIDAVYKADDLSYSYEIVESPLPVKNYTAKLWVEDSDQPNRTVIHWDAQFDANGASDDDAKKKINDIFAAGLKGIKKIAVENAPPDE